MQRAPFFWEQRLQNFTQSVERYGISQSVLSLGLQMLARLFDFSLCRIYMQPGKPYSFSPTGVYPCIEVENGAGFHQNLHKDLSNVDYQWAFARGDVCVANFDAGTIVGYSFTSSLPTRVIEEVEFFFPEWCSYIFADVTTVPYRGLRLAKDRWLVRRDANRKKHVEPPRGVYYIDVANSASLKSDKSDGIEAIRLGYCLYIRWRGRIYCWNSRGARRFGIGFRPR